MDLIKELVQYLGPAFASMTLVSVLTMRTLSTRTRKQEQDQKNLALDILRIEGYMVKYCGLPIDVFLTDLKDKGVYLSYVSNDDLLGQILDRSIRSS